MESLNVPEEEDSGHEHVCCGLLVSPAKFVPDGLCSSDSGMEIVTRNVSANIIICSVTFVSIIRLQSLAKYGSSGNFTRKYRFLHVSSTSLVPYHIRELG